MNLTAIIILTVSNLIVIFLTILIIVFNKKFSNGKSIAAAGQTHKSGCFGLLLKPLSDGGKRVFLPFLREALDRHGKKIHEKGPQS